MILTFLIKTGILKYTVNLVFFECFGFHEFVTFGLFTKCRIRELSISMIGSDHNNDFARFFNFEFVLLAKIKTSQILPDLQYIILTFYSVPCYSLF